MASATVQNCNTHTTGLVNMFPAPPSTSFSTSEPSTLPSRVTQDQGSIAEATRNEQGPEKSTEKASRTALRPLQMNIPYAAPSHSLSPPPSREPSQDRGTSISSTQGKGKSGLNLKFPLSPPMTATSSQFSTSPGSSPSRCVSPLSFRAASPIGPNRASTISPSRLNPSAPATSNGRSTPLPVRSSSRNEFYRPSTPSSLGRDSNRSSTFSTLSGMSDSSTSSINQYRTLLEYERQGMKIERELWEEERKVLMENANSLKQENERLKRIIEELMAEKEKEKENAEKNRPPSPSAAAPIAVSPKDESGGWARRELANELNGPKITKRGKRSMSAVHPADLEDAKAKRGNSDGRPNTSMSIRCEKADMRESLRETGTPVDNLSVQPTTRSRSNSTNSTKTTHTIPLSMELPLSALYNDPRPPPCPPLPSPSKTEFMMNSNLPPLPPSPTQKENYHDNDRSTYTDLANRTSTGPFYNTIRRDPITGRLIRCATQNPNSSSTSLASSITAPQSPFYTFGEDEDEDDEYDRDNSNRFSFPPPRKSRNRPTSTSTIIYSPENNPQYRNTMIADVLDGVNIQYDDLDYLNMIMDEREILDDAFGRMADGTDQSSSIFVGLIDEATIPVTEEEEEEEEENNGYNGDYYDDDDDDYMSDMDHDSFSDISNASSNSPRRGRERLRRVKGPSMSKSDKILGRVLVSSAGRPGANGNGNGNGGSSSGGHGWFRHKTWGRA